MDGGDGRLGHNRVLMIVSAFEKWAGSEALRVLPGPPQATYLRDQRLGTILDLVVGMKEVDMALNDGVRVVSAYCPSAGEVEPIARWREICEYRENSHKLGLEGSDFFLELDDARIDGVRGSLQRVE